LDSNTEGDAVVTGVRPSEGDLKLVDTVLCKEVAPQAVLPLVLVLLEVFVDRGWPLLEDWVEDLFPVLLDLGLGLDFLEKRLG
jgi:hypothetical protein